MTTNQLSYQRNLIAEDEARVKEAQMREQERHNLEQEALARREQNLTKLLRSSEIEQKERENKAKYGTYAYLDYGEEEPKVSQFAKTFADVFGYLLRPFSSLFGKSR